VLQLQGSHVLFLTNCHATPWQSVIHASDITLSFLDCSPPGYHKAVLRQNSMLSTGLFHVATGSDNISEEEVFFRAPEEQLCHVFGGCPGGGEGSIPAPSYLVMYGDLMDEIGGFIAWRGYEEVARFGYVPTDRSSVVILSRRQ
jgi:hypothetical protein